jgi:outer membrane receptor protein involved in Fe transport
MNDYAPGISTVDREFGALVGQRGLQMDTNAKTVFMLDGRNLIMRSNFGYMLPLDLPLLGYVDRVEVVNGPGAIVHGSGAISGFVNIVPKNGKDYQGWQTSTEYGFKDDLRKTEISYGHDYKEGNLFVYGGMLRSDGWEPQADGPMSMSDTSTQYGKPNYYSGNLVRPTVGLFDPTSTQVFANWQHQDFKLMIDFMDMYYLDRTQTPTGLGVNAADYVKNGTRNHSHLLVEPKFTLDINESDTVEFSPSVYMADDVYYDRSLGKMIERRKSSAHNNGAEIEYLYKSVYRTERFDNHLPAIGMSISHRDFYEQMSFLHSRVAGDNVGSAAYEPEDGSYFDWNEYSLFGEDVITMTDKWTMSAGLRAQVLVMGDDKIISSNGGYNQLSTKKFTGYSPRLANAYQFTDDITGKLSYQKGFRNPDVAQMQIMHLAANGIDPEEVDSFEANYSQMFFDKKLTCDVNTFLNFYQNTIGFNRSTIGGATTGNDNLPTSYRSKGLELVGKFEPNKANTFGLMGGIVMPDHFSKTIGGDAGYGNIVPVDEHAREFSATPARYVKGSTEQKWFKEKFVTEIDSTYFSGTNSLMYYEHAGATKNQQVFPGFSKARIELNAAARYNITKNASVKLAGRNLLECRYSKPTNAPGGTGTSTYVPPVGHQDRTVYLSFDLKF